MRIIYMILLGMVLFNGMLFISGYFIRGGVEAGAVNVTSDDDYTRFGNLNNSNWYFDYL